MCEGMRLSEQAVLGQHEWSKKSGTTDQDVGVARLGRSARGVENEAMTGRGPEPSIFESNDTLLLNVKFVVTQRCGRGPVAETKTIPRKTGTRLAPADPESKTGQRLASLTC